MATYVHIFKWLIVGALHCISNIAAIRGDEN